MNLPIFLLQRRPTTEIAAKVALSQGAATVVIDVNRLFPRNSGLRSDIAALARLEALEEQDGNGLTPQTAIEQADGMQNGAARRLAGEGASVWPHCDCSDTSLT